MFDWDNFDNISKINSLGATISPFYFPLSIQDRQLRKIQEFISTKSPKFRNVLRINQLGRRYKYLTYIKTNPLKKSSKFKYYRIVGLFYEDLKPENGIQFKQDLIIEDSANYTFVVGESWFKIFPELKQFLGTFIMLDKQFGALVASNGKYGFRKGNQYNHHYKSITDLPTEIQKFIKNANNS